MERRGQVGRHVGGQGVADRVGAGDQDYGGQELAPVGAHHVPDPQRPLGPHDVGLDGGQVGGLLVVDLGPGAAEGRGVLDAGPQVQGDPAHGQGHEEGDAPAPLGHDVLGQDDHEDGDQAGPQGVAHVGAPVEQGGVEAALLVRGVLGDEGGRPGVLPAGGEALDELEADEQDGRPDAEHGARRQDADAEGRQRHHHEGEGEDLLAPQAVPELAQDDAPQGPGHEGDGEDGQGEEVLGGVGGPGQEGGADEDDDVGVDAHVVPLHDVAHDGAEDGPAQGRLLDDDDVVVAQAPAAAQVGQPPLLAPGALDPALGADDALARPRRRGPRRDRGVPVLPGDWSRFHSRPLVAHPGGVLVPQRHRTGSPAAEVTIRHRTIPP